MPQPWLGDEVYDAAMEAIDATRRDGREHGFALCALPTNGRPGPTTILPGTACSGDECSIDTQESACAEGTTRVGAFHTHPSGAVLPSTADMTIYTLRGEPLFCIGAPTQPDTTIEVETGLTHTLNHDAYVCYIHKKWGASRAALKKSALPIIREAVYHLAEQKGGSIPETEEIQNALLATHDSTLDWTPVWYKFLKLFDTTTTVR